MTVDVVKHVAVAVARKYARQVWWADVDDMVQEAFVAAWRARDTFDPAVGVPFDGYAWRAASLAVRRWLWRQSSPVSTSTHRPEVVRGCHRAPVDEQAPGGTRPDEMLLRAERGIRLRMRVGSVLEPWPMARDVLLAEQRPSEVAARRSVEPMEVYRETGAARQAVQADAELWRMWQEAE